MNKSQLIDAMALEAKLTKGDAKKALDAFVKVTSDTLKVGEKIALIGFGSFGIAERAERMGRNPNSGKTMKIAAKKVIKFKAGRELTDQLK